MPPNMRPLMRVARLQQQSALFSRNPSGRAFISSQGNNTMPSGTPGESSTQALPIGPYYESMLTDPQPIPKAKPEQPPASSPKAPSRSNKKPAAAAAAAAAPKSKANEESSASASASAASSSSSKSKSKSSSGTTTSTTATATTPAAASAASASASAAAAAAAAATTASTVPPQPTAEPATAQEKARIIFGSRLAGPAERADRLQSIRNRSTLIAGVLVPPRPEEPDNCCMSGCVNCVWDRYGEELEDWAAASARAAEASSQAQKTKSRESVIRGDASAVRDTTRVSSSTPSGVAISMDDDGGGSESNWKPEDIIAGKQKEKEKEKEMAKTDRPKIAKDLWDDELYSNVPVGIREFMKTEKKLKKKHQEEGTLGG